MSRAPFSLFPFPGQSPPPGLAVAGSIARTRESLAIRYELSGDPSLIELPAPADFPERRDRLWEETCLELFLGEAGCAGYLELNLSPAGHWNAYRFDAPRAGMRREAALDALPFRVERIPGRILAVSLELALPRLFPPGRPLEAGVSAVIRDTAGATTHWALAHPGPRPDFHRRDAFRLDLPPRV